MIKLENKQNVSAPDATYPYGNIKDNTGANDGTPVSTLVHADFHQFFAKMFDVAEGTTFITSNGLVENDVNGFQYYDALLMSARLANKALLAYTIESVIGDIYDNTKPYAMKGLADSGTAIAIGYVYYNGTLYICGGLNYGAVINDLQFNVTAENVITITDSATPGLFQYDDIVFMSKKHTSFTSTIGIEGTGTVSASVVTGTYYLRGDLLIVSILAVGVVVTGTPDVITFTLPPFVNASGNNYGGYSIAGFADNSSDNQVRSVRYPSSNGSEMIGVFPNIFSGGTWAAFTSGEIQLQIELKRA